MSLIKRMRKQKAVYWARGSPDVYGEFTFADPVEIDCRWEDTAQEYLDPQGETKTSKSIVYVDRVMSPGDRLLEGELDSNVDMADSFEIQRFDRLPNIRNTEVLLTAFL